MEVGQPAAASRSKVVVPLTAWLPADRIKAGRFHLYVTIFDTTGHELGFHHFLRDLDRSEAEQFAVTARLTFPHGNYRLVMTVRNEDTNEIGIASTHAAF